jgi:hypothetical protein
MAVAVEQDSIHINYRILPNAKSLHTFALGGTYNTTTVKSDTKSEKARRTMLDYLAVGLFGKVGVGFGLFLILLLDIR